MARFFILTLLSAALLIAAGTAQVQNCIEKCVLSVTGASTRSITPTIAVVSLATEAEEKTEKKVQDRLAVATGDLLEFLRTANATEIETTGAMVNPHQGNSNSMTTYNGKHSMTFETSVEESGSVIGGVVNAGASQINGVRLRATNENAAPARKKAISEAVDRARSKTQTVAMAIEKKVEEEMSIQMVDDFKFNAGGAGDVSDRLLTKSFSTGGSAKIIGKDIEISASVYVPFSLATIDN